MWLKLLIVLSLLLLLLAIKANLSLSIFLPGLLLAFLFKMTPTEIIHSTWKSISDWNTIKLLLIIFLILILVEIQKEKGSLQKLVKGMEGLFGNKWMTITLSPSLIGLLPMPGGALVSAPVLNEALGEGEVSPELKTFINYWFRHIWEYFWPLYQGFILTVTIFGIKTIELIKNQFYFTFIAAALGYVSMLIFLPRLKNDIKKEPFIISIKTLIKGTWEILLIIIMLILFPRLDILVSLSIAIISSIVISIPKRKIWGIIVRAFNLRILLLLASVMIFKGYILNSELSSLLKNSISGSHSLLAFLMVSIPFSLGFLTGVNTAFAGISFPLFIPIVGHNLNYISLLYISGFSGVLLSPLHLCLALSAEYYEAKLIRVYKYLTLPVLIILAIAIIVFV